MLLAELIDRSKAAGLKEMIAVIADQGAEASIALHEKFGFEEIGRMGRVGFKFERWLGTVLLQTVAQVAERMPDVDARRGARARSSVKMVTSTPAANGTASADGEAGRREAAPGCARPTTTRRSAGSRPRACASGTRSRTGTSAQPRACARNHAHRSTNAAQSTAATSGHDDRA